MTSNISTSLNSLNIMVLPMKTELNIAIEELYSAVVQNKLNGFRIYSEHPLCVHGRTIYLDKDVEAIPTVEKNGQGYKKKVILRYHSKLPHDFFNIGDRPADAYEREMLTVGLKEDLRNHMGLEAFVADEIIFCKIIPANGKPISINEFKEQIKKAENYLKESKI